MQCWSAPAAWTVPRWNTKGETDQVPHILANIYHIYRGKKEDTPIAPKKRTVLPRSRSEFIVDASHFELHWKLKTCKDESDKLFAVRRFQLRLSWYLLPEQKWVMFSLNYKLFAYFMAELCIGNKPIIDGKKSYKTLAFIFGHNQKMLSSLKSHNQWDKYLPVLKVASSHGLGYQVVNVQLPRVSL